MKRDWAKLEAEFIKGDESLKDFGTRHGIPYSTVRNEASARSWNTKRQEVCDNCSTIAVQKYIEKTADSLAEQIEQCNSADIELATQGRALIRERFAAKPTDASTIRTLLLATKTAQEITRTALGADQYQAEQEALQARRSIKIEITGLPPRQKDEDEQHGPHDPIC